jgi:hypothetical protein
MKWLILLLLPLQIFAQNDSLTMLPRVDTSKVYTEFNVQSKNIWRGVDFGSQLPTVQAYVTYAISDRIEVGTLATATFTQEGYGNALNLFASYRINNLIFYIDDYYFEGDKTNMETDFFNFKGCHLVEARIKYERERFEFLAGYMIYGGTYYVAPSNQNAVYIEALVNLIKNDKEKLQFSMGGITSPSALNFNDKAGITNVNLKYVKTIKYGDLWTLLSLNPSFKTISPMSLPRVGYGTAMLNFAIGITIK